MLLVSCIRSKENAIADRHSNFSDSLQVILNRIYNLFINHSNISFARFIRAFTSDMGGGDPNSS